MGKIKTILDKELIGGTTNTAVYPVTSTKAVYDENNIRLDELLKRKSVVNVSTNYNVDHLVETLTLTTAIAKVAESDRTLGFVGTFYTTEGWNTYQFTGDSLNNWSDESLWISMQSNSKLWANNAMKSIGRYMYWKPTTKPYIKTTSTNRILTWDKITIEDIVNKKTYIKYYNTPLSMTLPLGGILIIYAELLEGDSELTYYYDRFGGDLNRGETHTSWYKDITDAKDVIILGIVETYESEEATFFDIMKIGSYPWGEVPSTTKDVDDVITNVTSHNTYIEKLKTTYGNYTYWDPVGDPVVSKDGEYTRVTYNPITIVRNSDMYIVVTNYSQTVSFTATDVLIYYDIDDKKMYYTGPWNAVAKKYITEDYKVIEDNSRVIPLAFYGGEIFMDILAITSRYIPGRYDLSHKGLAMRLYPDSKEPTIYNKYKWDITGTIITEEVDVRATATLYNKHKYVYIKGSVAMEDSDLPTLSLYVADAVTHNNTYETSVPLNNDGSFDSLITIPNSTWDNISLSTGCNIFLFIMNVNQKKTTLTVKESYVADYAGKDNPIILDNEGIATLENKIEVINNIVNIKDDDVIYGNRDSVTSLDWIYPVEAHVGWSATTTNSSCPVDGFLKEITTNINKAGAYKISVGVLDQYPRFIVSRTFEVDLNDGYNTKDISELKIPIYKGEQIAIGCTSTLGASGESSLRYTRNTASITHELCYGPDNGEWELLKTDFGGEIDLSYKVISVDSLFAAKEEVKELTARVDEQEKQINSLRYVYDDKGVAYKITVVNGNLTIKSMAYSKVLALGNSMTSHDYKSTIGYYGDWNWAMASTNKTTTTWTTYLKTILQQKSTNVQMDLLNIADWETNYIDCDLTKLFQNNKSDYDLIVFRAGENGTADSAYSQGVSKLIEYLKSNYPNATIIMTSMFWHSSDKEAVFKAVADKYNLMYVSFGAIGNSCLLGQMLMGKDDIMHPIIHSGVAMHCSDRCFFDFANILAQALGYTEITGKHTLTINSSLKYNINEKVQVENSYVTILTYSSAAPTVTITYGDVSKIADRYSLSNTSWINTPTEKPTWASVFLMPASDVTVTIV